MYNYRHLRRLADSRNTYHNPDNQNCNPCYRFLSTHQHHSLPLLQYKYLHHQLSYGIIQENLSHPHLHSSSHTTYSHPAQPVGNVHPPVLGVLLPQLYNAVPEVQTDPAAYLHIIHCYRPAASVVQAHHMQILLPPRPDSLPEFFSPLQCR